MCHPGGIAFAAEARYIRRIEEASERLEARREEEAKPPPHPPGMDGLKRELDARWGSGKEVGRAGDD